MKYENGKVTLEEGEKRYGNFFVKADDDKVTLMDLSSMMTVEVRTAIASGAFLKMAKESEGTDQFLELYVKTLLTMLSVVPDVDYLIELNKSAKACMERHRNIYGMTEEVDPEADREDIEEQKKLHESIETLKKGIGNE